MTKATDGIKELTAEEYEKFKAEGKEVYKKWGKEVNENWIAEFGRGDGSDYNILKDAVDFGMRAEGMSCEIGIREGAGSKIIIEGYQQRKDLPRVHIGIDPYGGIPYEYTDDEKIWDAYPNKLRDCAIPELFKMCAGTNVDFLFFQMTDEQFFKRFADGVPLYLNHQEFVYNKYGMVFFDGPHTTEATLNETKFFAPRATKNAIFVYDDVVNFYDHDMIKDYLLKIDGTWEQVVITAAKAVYHKYKE